MAKKLIEGELLEDAHIITHPVRYQIVELVGKRPMYINALSRALGEKKGLVAYHLAVLQERGFMKSKYEIFVLLNPGGLAIRVYTVTDKVAEVKTKLKEAL